MRKAVLPMSGRPMRKDVPSRCCSNERSKGATKVGYEDGIEPKH